MDMSQSRILSPSGGEKRFDFATWPGALDAPTSLAETILGTMEEGVMVIDAEGRIITVNRAFTLITGFTGEDVLGHPVPFGTPNFWVETIASMKSQPGGGSLYIREGWASQKTGNEFAFRAVIRTSPDDTRESPLFIVFLSDITGRCREAEVVRYQRHYDTLTRLPNRALFIEKLGEMFSELPEDVLPPMVGVLLVNLDGFGSINDVFGHSVGDAVLSQAARRLMLATRRGDTVARTTGDEFGLIVRGHGPADMRSQMAAAADRLLVTLTEPITHAENCIPVSASIGIAISPEDGDSAETLMRNALSALAQAKNWGQASYQFFTRRRSRQHTDERKLLLDGLTRALDRDEFTLRYQPKYNTTTGEIAGVEALLRWNHETLGEVSPTRFIPYLEETGLIGAVGQWVLEMGCRQHRAWKDAGWHVPVAVNVSARQFREKTLPQTVEKILARTGIEPSGLDLEITETMMMADTDSALVILQALRGMGVRLALDDFGSGYSSLSYLRRFPLQTIKIDRSFVTDIVTCEEDLAIVRAIIAIGHSLRREIVAEGVEHPMQFKLLRDLKCDLIQGFFLQKPVTASEIETLLRSSPSEVFDCPAAS